MMYAKECRSVMQAASHLTDAYIDSCCHLWYGSSYGRPM